MKYIISIQERGAPAHGGQAVIVILEATSTGPIQELAEGYWESIGRSGFPSYTYQVLDSTPVYQYPGKNPLGSFKALGKYGDQL